MLPGMPDFSQILLQAQQMQAEMERAQASLSEQEVTGTAGGGLVTAVVNGSGDLLRLSIDPSVVDPADVETLEDLVVAAVHDARRAAQDIASDAMGGVASGLAGSLDLSAMGLSVARVRPWRRTRRTTTRTTSRTTTRTTRTTRTTSSTIDVDHRRDR